MLRLLALTLLMLSLAVPSASWALGLGDIHVESTLHQPLAAQIDLIGATHDDLARLSARIADQEMFQRYGLERPAFLSATAVRVSQDGQGRPVLVLSSTQAFTDPVVIFLIDIHSPNGELIREYSILLDPAGLAPQHNDPESAAATPVPTPAAIKRASALVTATEPAVTAADVKASGRTYTVAPRDTLNRIVTVAGIHSRSDRHRMMIAIFRANPTAFQANVNILRTGAKLRFPSRAELSAVSADAANRELASQMAAWRAANHRIPAAVAVTSVPIADAKPDTESHGTVRPDLTRAVESLEKPPAKQSTVPVAAQSAPAPAMATKRPEPADEPASAPPRHGVLLALLAGGLALALAAGAWSYRRARSGDNSPTTQQAEPTPSVRRDPEGDRSVKAETLPLSQQPAPGASSRIAEVRGRAERRTPTAAHGESGWFKVPASARGNDVPTDETTVILPAAPIHVEAATVVDPTAEIEMSDESVARKFAFFNPESEINTTHVVIASGSKEPPPFVERRRSPVDVLRQAIEREPGRSDFRLKLLELYYTAAAENRQAFLEVTRQLAKSDPLASAKDWPQIADMGRIIAPDDELFCENVDNKAVA